MRSLRQKIEMDDGDVLQDIVESGRDDGSDCTNIFGEKRKFVMSLMIGNSYKVCWTFELSAHSMKGLLIHRGLSERETPAVSYILKFQETHYTEGLCLYYESQQGQVVDLKLKVCK